MRKVKIEELDKVQKLLSKLKIKKCLSKSKIFFPIEVEKTVEVDNFQLSLRDTNEGASSLTKAGLVIVGDREDNLEVSLGYATTEYAPKFDFLGLAELLGTKYSKKEIEILRDLECFLIKNEYILEIFDL